MMDRQQGFTNDTKMNGIILIRIFLTISNAHIFTKSIFFCFEDKIRGRVNLI